jgi:hypothetical protein
MCDKYTWQKAKHINKSQTNLLVREEVNIRTTTTMVQWKKKNSLVVSPKELDAKMNWLAVSCQS